MLTTAKRIDNGEPITGYYVKLDKHHIIPEKGEHIKRISANKKIDVDRVIGRLRVEIDPESISTEEMGFLVSMNDYKRTIKKRYQHRADSLWEIFPRGVFTKDKQGNFVGADIMTRQAMKELCELQRLDEIQIIKDTKEELHEHWPRTVSAFSGTELVNHFIRLLLKNLEKQE